MLPNFHAIPLYMHTILEMRRIFINCCQMSHERHSLERHALSTKVTKASSTVHHSNWYQSYILFGKFAAYQFSTWVHKHSRREFPHIHTRVAWDAVNVRAAEANPKIRQNWNLGNSLLYVIAEAAVMFLSLSPYKIAGYRGDNVTNCGFYQMSHQWRTLSSD